MLVFCRHTVVYNIVPYHVQILPGPPLCRFVPSYITIGDIEIKVISRGACSLAKRYDEYIA